MRCLSLAGKDFKISRMKYRAAMLYAAERSQLYRLPLLNVHIE